MPPVTSKRSVSLVSQGKRAGFAEEYGSNVLTQYLHDIRSAPLLSQAQEQALGKQIQDNRSQWRQLLLTHLLHVPLFLAWWPRLRRGAVPLALLRRADTHATPETYRHTLAELHRLAGQMRCAVQTQDERLLQTVPALRTAMHALLDDWECPLDVLQHVWRRFDTAMRWATVARQPQRAASYVIALGYSREELCHLWGQLSGLYTLAEEAKHEMVIRNLRLVVNTARKMSYTGLPLSDLIQEGNIGLMRAVDGFDYRRNLKFSTYALWWIRQAMQRARVSYALLRLPEYMHKNVHRVHRLHDIFVATHGRAPTVQEIAQHVDMPLERVQWSLQYTAEHLSMDRPLPGQDRALRDVLPDTHVPDSAALLEQQYVQRHTQHALACLTPREAAIICRRFGLDDHPGETLEQISRDLQLSRERVRQIATGALRKLKRQLAALER